MIRRPPHADDDGPERAPADDGVEPLSSTPPRLPDVVEVALFMIPGPRKPGATVVDLRNANKISFPDPDSYLPFDPNAPLPTFADLPLQVTDGAPDVVPPVEGQLAALASELLPDDAIAFPSEEAAATRVVRWSGAAAAIARRGTDVLVSGASAMSHVRVKAGRASRRVTDTLRGATPTVTQLRGRAAHVSKQIGGALALAGPAASRVRSAAGRRLAAARAQASPVVTRVSQSTSRALRRTQGQLDVWRRTDWRPALSRLQVDRRLHLGAAAAASILLAIAVTNLDTGSRRDPALAVLDGRPLAPVAPLSGHVVASRPRLVALPVVDDVELEVERERLAAAEARRRTVTPQESKAAAVAALKPTATLPTFVEERPLAPRVPDAVTADSAPAAAAASAPSALTPAAAVSAPPVERAAVAARAGDADGIAEALRHLARAYERRDAELAKAVWPTVNERALARAFEGLRSQTVAFDRCQVNIVGSSGEAQCRGTTTYVPRVGSRYERTESRQWQFRLQKGMDSWLITSAAAR